MTMPGMMDSPLSATLAAPIKRLNTHIKFVGKSQPPGACTRPAEEAVEQAPQANIQLFHLFHGYFV